MDPITTAALINVGAGLLSGLGNSRSSQRQLEQQQRQFDTQMGQTQAQQALAASQMDPLAQQRSRQRAALVEQLLKGSSSPVLQGNRFVGGFQWTPEKAAAIGSYFTPQARQAAEGDFARTANTASAGRYGTPDFAAVGYAQPAATAPTTQLPPLERLRQRLMQREVVA